MELILFEKHILLRHSERLKLCASIGYHIRASAEIEFPEGSKILCRDEISDISSAEAGIRLTTQVN